MQQQNKQVNPTYQEGEIAADSVIEVNRDSYKVQYWCMNISTETWRIEEGNIGELKTIHILDFQSLFKNEKKGESVSNWLICYFKDTPDNPHIGQPIAPQEMAISLLDSEGEAVCSESIEKAKKRIAKVLKPCLNRMGIVMDPDVVLTSASYRRHGGRQMRAWMTQLDGLGRPIEKMVKNKYRHEVSTGERVPRELSSQHTFVHYFYWNRPGGVPTKPYTQGKEYEDGYVQAAPKEDPEIGYVIKNISPYPEFHIGDKVVACEPLTQRFIGLLIVKDVMGGKITLQIEERYDNAVFINRVKGKQYLSDVLIPIKLSASDFNEMKKVIVNNNPHYRNNNSRKYSDTSLHEEALADDNLLEDIKQTLFEKKCVILQGAPGVGKTFLAKRIAYAHMRERNDYRIEFV